MISHSYYMNDRLALHENGLWLANSNSIVAWKQLGTIPRVFMCMLF